MADLLPECLVQKILCFLTYKRSSKMSIVSKTWLEAWSTLPNLELYLDRGKSNIKMIDTIMERYRDRKIPIKKLRLSESIIYDRCRVSPPIPIDNCLDIALQSGLQHLVLNSISYPLPISTILTAKSLRKLDIMDCTLSLANGVVNQNSLTELSIGHVELDKNIFETLLNSCPLIETFTFEGCKRFDVSYLRKIKSVNLKVLKIEAGSAMWEIDAPNLVSFEYKGLKIPEFKTARQLEKSKIVFYSSDYRYGDWFGKLRKFLSKSTGSCWSQVTIRSRKCNEIEMEQHNRVGAIALVNVLEVEVVFQDMDCSSFVNALLWSCRPKRLNLQPRLTLFTAFSDRLMYMKNTTMHSRLKQVQAFDENNQLLQLGSEQLTESVLPSWGSKRRNWAERAYFILDWCS